ncbi:hypothetical protein BH23CHL8_BH23CHL8_16350 [soil metagenome]
MGRNDRLDLEGVVQKINLALARHMELPRCGLWAQDPRL